MIDKIKKIVDENPNKLAYIVNDKSITYKELWDKANQYSILLKKQGNTPVIIYGGKDINIIISILSCILSSRAYVPINHCTPVNRIKQIIGITKSTLILSDDSISFDSIDCLNLEELNKFSNNEINENENDIVYMIFTSGTTGIPKGVPISKTNLNNFINWISNIEPLSTYKDINVLNQASFSFDLSVADLFYSLCNGHTLIAFDGDIVTNYEKLFNIMKDIDVSVMTPTFMKLCLLNNDFNVINYPKFKCVYFCGEKLENKTVRKIFERFPNLKIINAYGPTEATSAVSSILITKEILDKYDILPVGEVGKFACDIEIVNDEIVLKGDSVFSGYLGNYEEDNTNSFKTGDFGYIKDNKLFCKGRIDNQIKYKGYRIELSDIENNINLINGVKECAVVSKCNEEGSVKAIKAFVILENNKDSNYIKEELGKMIPSYMIPKIIIVKELPINQNGKIDRKKLSEL